MNILFARLPYFLHVHQPLIKSFTLYQSFVCSLFHYFALAEDNDRIRMTHSAKAVGNDNAGTVLHQLIQCILYQFFRLGIQCGSCFVQDEDGRIL